MASTSGRDQHRCGATQSSSLFSVELVTFCASSPVFGASSPVFSLELTRFRVVSAFVEPFEPVAHPLRVHTMHVSSSIHSIDRRIVYLVV